MSETSAPPARRRNPLRRFYDWVLHWSATPYAAPAAMLVVFLSPWMIPLPPDVLFVPLLMARPDRTLRYGLLASILYTLGWIAGYGLGYYGHIYFGEAIAQKLGLDELLAKVKPTYDEWGIWGVLAGSATPVSDKLFSIGSGILKYDFGKFVLAATIGAFLRMMAVAVLLKVFGPPVLRFVEKYLEWVALGAILLVISLLILLQSF